MKHFAANTYYTKEKNIILDDHEDNDNNDTYNYNYDVLILNSVTP